MEDPKEDEPQQPNQESYWRRRERIERIKLAIWVAGEAVRIAVEVIKDAGLGPGGFRLLSEPPEPSRRFPALLS